MTIFEKIITKTIPASIVYEDDNFLAFNDINPLAPIHIVVIPKIASNDGQSIDNYPLTSLPEYFRVITHIARELGLNKSGYRVITNVGDDAGQTVKHIHFHIIGGKKLGKPC